MADGGKEFKEVGLDLGEKSDEEDIGMMNKKENMSEEEGLSVGENGDCPQKTVMIHLGGMKELLESERANQRESEPISEEEVGTNLPGEEERSNSPTAPSEEKKSSPSWWNNGDWWSVWIGWVFFLLFCLLEIGFNSPMAIIEVETEETSVSSRGFYFKMPSLSSWQFNPLAAFDSNDLFLPLLGILMCLAMWFSLFCLSTPGWKYFPVGFSLVFFLTILAKLLATNVYLSKLKLGSSVFAIILGFFFVEIFSH